MNPFSALYIILLVVMPLAASPLTGNVINLKPPAVDGEGEVCTFNYNKQRR